MKYWASFIAVFFDADVADNILGYGKANWGDHLSAYKIEKGANLHMTLFYLGWSDSKDLETIKNILLGAPALPKLEVTGKILTFNTSEDCRYVTLEVRHTPEIAALYSYLERSLLQADIFFKAQGFVPHITILKMPKDLILDFHDAPFPLTVTGDRLSLSSTQSTFYEPH
ncbi:2'-5' RNA ligase family protein [Flavobacterium sp. MAH-1]|uniref:2'-5' RNA ligase family protein n=1 Tax=Flavobacterium agri TaxID=2743471 RepID=A0A7Y8Y397_9FLAO|nr:2'-5' RNA ligase family protein [Flavobacterium agri]NUY80465.1 2'-5' RNA ligase family protein [Flavobacterium agri]NYA70490.1 2'-5' RNA ligase family protein [Flavobacterium agri]